jgi:SAM-dependent methyltransferase
VKNIPERLQWAVEELSLRGDEAILEIGCGRGVAVSLVCPLLRGGTITGIDRSATAIDAARERNREHVGAGKAFFHQASIEAFEGRARAFHIAFAVNVNLFWLDAAKGLDSVRRLLADDGRLFLFYEAPSLNQRTKIAAQLAERLAANGYRIAAKHEAGNGRTQLLGVTALPAARA